MTSRRQGRRRQGGSGWCTAAVIAAVLALGAGSVAGATAMSAAQDARVDSEVRAALERFAGRVNAADWEAVIDCYAADPRFRWLEDGEVRYGSRDEVAEAYRGLGGVFTEFEILLTAVRVQPLADDAAAVSLLFHQSMATASGMRLEIEGAILATMIDSDGVWRFLLGHTSTRRAGPGAEAEAPKE